MSDELKRLAMRLAIHVAWQASRAVFTPCEVCGYFGAEPRHGNPEEPLTETYLCRECHAREAS